MKPIKEQYKEIVCGWNEERTENVSNRCTEIADEFAIGFGEYLDSLTYQDMGEFTIKELLEIYKKEKGL